MNRVVALAVVLWLTAVAAETPVVCPTVLAADETPGQTGAGRARPKYMEPDARLGGLVRDESGKPVQGATIFVWTDRCSVPRAIQTLIRTTTDAQGRYEVKAILDSLSTGIVIAHVQGRPLGWRGLYHDNFHGEWTEDVTSAVPWKPGETLPLDVVIPNRGGVLEVRVECNGKPARKAWVSLASESNDFGDPWMLGDDKERGDYEKLVYPVAQTGEDGVARFEHLLPGTYRMIATESKRGPVRHLSDLWGEKTRLAVGSATGISVRLGQTTTHRLAICPQSRRVDMQVFQVNGKPLAGDNVAFGFGLTTSDRCSMSWPLDTNGQTSIAFESPGLWHVQFRYRESSAKWEPYREPIASAQALLAVSPRLDSKMPVPIRAVSFELGAIVAVLQDVDGNPLEGKVELGYDRGKPFSITPTDEDGVARFPGVPKEKYILRAHLPGQPLPNLDAKDQPLPTDESLTGRRAILWMPIEPKFNTEQRVVLQMQDLGYVRGVLKPTRGTKTADYCLRLDRELLKRRATIHYRLDTGEFVAGPFAPGKVKLIAWDHANHKWGAQSAKVEVTVAPGQVTHTEIAVPAMPVRPLERPDIAASSNTRQSRLEKNTVERLTGRVFLSDGKTPALAARVTYFEPDDWPARYTGTTDALGVLHPRCVDHSALADDIPPPTDYPDRPVAVAWLPGQCGAVIRPVTDAKAIDWVLPEPTTLRGMVRVAGKQPNARGQIRVLAAYQGKEALNEVLSVQTTSQADGSFVLHGLTKGKYQAQAALDGIWLSPTVEVNVEQSDPQPVNLAIGAPAGPVVVKIVGPQGQPLCAREVALDRPAGPLNSLWPRTLLSDGAGEVHIPALEAGLHRLRVVGTNVEQEITAEALPAQQRKEERIEVK